MVTTTRADMRRNVYKHLIKEILGLSMSHPIPSSLEAEKANSIPDILSLREHDIATLRYKFKDRDDAEQILPLGKGEHRLLVIIPSFVIYK
jgi:hypothetical protein